MKKKSLKTVSGKRVLSVGLALAMTISLFSGAGVSEVQAADNGVTYEEEVHKAWTKMIEEMMAFTRLYPDNIVNMLLLYHTL